VTLLALGVIEGIGCIVLRLELARGHPIGPVLCVLLTVALLGFAAYAMRAARR